MYVYEIMFEPSLPNKDSEPSNDKLDACPETPVAVDSAAVKLAAMNVRKLISPKMIASSHSGMHEIRNIS